jgi:hypothetical protein
MNIRRKQQEEQATEVQIIIYDIAHQRRCFLPEEKHQLDEHHCITQQ